MSEIREKATDQLYALVAQIPEGRCVAYSTLGKALRTPVSGFLVGRWMANCPAGLPWWRVVAKDGSMPVYKKDPNAEFEQRNLLESEGVPILDGHVVMDAVEWYPE